MANASNILNDDDFFGDAVDRPREGIKQHRKRKCLKSVIYINGHRKGWTRPAMKL